MRRWIEMILTLLFSSSMVSTVWFEGPPRSPRDPEQPHVHEVSGRRAARPATKSWLLTRGHSTEERMIVAMKRYLGIALAVLIVSSMVGYRLAVRSGADGMKR